MVLLILLSLVAWNFVDSFAAGEVGCPDEWVSYHNDCYYFYHTQAAVSFTEAEHFCKQRGSHLVNVGGDAENNFLKGHMTLLGSHWYWMGLTDEAVEDEWKWFDTDEGAEFFDWAHGDPNNINNGNDEDCVIFWNNAHYQWADLPCSQKAYPVCERSVNDGPNLVG